MRWSVLLLALLSLGNAPSDPPVKITLYPKIAQAPATVHLKVIVERHPENRLVTIEIDGENYYQAGERPIEGDAGQRVWDEWWLDLPCGSYAVTVVLHRADRTTHRARETTKILGWECPTEEVQ